MLELENVVFRYSRRAEPVLRGVSLTLNDGEIGILLGKACDVLRDGAGKQLNVLGQIAQMRAELVFVPLRQLRTV